MNTEIILWCGAAVFALSSVFFFIRNKDSQEFNSALWVSVITLVSHLIFIAGIGVVTNGSGDALYWTRWIGYGFSCTLLMWVIATHIGLAPQAKTDLMYATALTMVTGALASVTAGWLMILFFIIGGATYMIMMKKLWSGNMEKLTPIKKYIYFGWSAFPLIFILSPEGYGLIPLWISLVIYLVLDIFSKIIFYLDLQNNLINS